MEYDTETIIFVTPSLFDNNRVFCCFKNVSVASSSVSASKKTTKFYEWVHIDLNISGSK